MGQFTQQGISPAHCANKIDVQTAALEKKQIVAERVKLCCPLANQTPTLLVDENTVS